MPSKLFQRRQANKLTPRTGSGDGFTSDRDENVEEVNTDDVRLAARRAAAARIAASRRKNAEGEDTPAPAVSAFKQWPTNALTVVQKALTSLPEYETDKAIQNAVVQIGDEVASRPLPIAEPGKVAATARERFFARRAARKKADGVSIDINNGNVHLDIQDTPDLGIPVPSVEPIVDITPLPETPVEVTDDAIVGEDIDFPKADWEAEVSTDQTKLSYNQWVTAQKK